MGVGRVIKEEEVGEKALDEEEWREEETPPGLSTIQRAELVT